MTQNGGAIYLQGGSLSFTGATVTERVVLENCYAGNSGGGIYARYDEDGNGQPFWPMVALGSHVDIVNNSAHGDSNLGDGFGSGGGICMLTANLTGAKGIGGSLR